MRTLEQIIRERPDQIRGRPRNWRDDLRDWWRRFSFYYDVIWPLFTGLVIAWLFAAGSVLLVTAMRMVAR